MAAVVTALTADNGQFVLSFPDKQDIVGDVMIEAYSAVGKTLGKQPLLAANFDQPVAMAVAAPGFTVLRKPATPAEPPPTRRIQGRVVELNGRPLPPAMQVLLLARDQDVPEEQPLEAILVAKADASGYFAGSVRNRSYATVVAVVSGIPGETPVRLESSLVPPRIPIVVDITKRTVPADSPEPGATSPSGAKDDCGCHDLTVPRTPTQDNIADAPGTFSTDLGTGACVKFNVPNRAIEEFDFYSVVRTTEPDISGIVTGVVKDEPVRIPPTAVVPASPPFGTPPPPPPAASRTTLATLQGAIRLAITPLFMQIVPWDVVELTVRGAIQRTGGNQLPLTFFQQFAGWGTVPIAFLWDPTMSPDFDDVINKSAAYAAGVGAAPQPPSGTAYGATAVAASYAATAAPGTNYMAKAPVDIYKLKGLKPRPPRRVPLDSTTPIDWDSTPTFYEATSIAHGHLLHFKQVWYADGYSLGDLLYSLPLAPGQKKFISVVDWERRERTTREEFTSADEGLQAAISRDRDLSEVVSGALSESMRGGSRNTTVGAGVGTGAAGNGSYQQFNFGALIGVSGGIGDSTSSAFQVSSRDVSSSSLQNLRDRTLQSASAVRNIRSTIVQTASQGESVRATSEVVANHNHCHALTIQYFEVLRHLKVTNELVDVQECLFVPLPMSEFNREKTLRWRQPLSTYLQRRELAPGFDATRRVFTEWGEVDAPVGRYADELVTAIFGEITLTIFIPLPPFPEKPAPPPPEQAADVAEKVTKALLPTEGFFGAVLAIATGGASLIAGAVAGATTDAVKATAQGAQALTQSMFALPTAEERYARFQQEVMPSAAAGFVDQLEVYARVGSNDVRLNGADFTLVSNYQPGSPLLVSVRGQVTNPVRRSDIASIIVKCAAPLPPGCRAIVNSASLRYQTRMFRRDLVNDPRVNDDIDLPIVAFTGAPSLPMPPFPGFPGLPGFGTLPTPPLPIGFPTGFVPVPGMSPIRAGNGATLYTPLDEWEQRSPRLEDIRLSAELIEHLNANLEYYHHAIWWTMDPNRRYMLLDGYEAPNAGGRSVASVVDNALIGIVGNSIVMPVSLGNRLDPQFRLVDGATLLEQYDPQSPAPPSRISLPTRGVFAEAVMGDCNACEEIDDTRFWRWDEVPIDEPPALDVTALAARRGEPSYGSPTAFPTPLVGMQTAPQAPDPAGIKAALDALAKSSFTDITGLAGTQANAAAALSKAMDTALAFGKEASDLAKQAAATKNVGQAMRQIDKNESEKKIDPDKAKQLRTSALEKMVGADGSLSPEDVAKRVKMVDDLRAGNSITAEAAQALNKTGLQQLMRGADDNRSDQIVASDLASGINPEQIASITSGGDGPTVIQTGLNTSGRTAPTHIRGVSGLGNESGEGSGTATQLWDGTKSLFEAMADGVADWKDAPDAELSDAVLQSIRSAAEGAALDAAETIPLVKAFKVGVELSLVFADAVGVALERTNARLASSYRVGELAGSGSDGLSEADKEAIQNVRRWQLNSVNEVNGILLAGIEAVAEDVLKRTLTWASSTVVKAAGGVARQLVENYLKHSGAQALLADGLAGLSKGVPKERLPYYKELLTTVVGLYVRQLDNPTLRSDMAALTRIDATKRAEKTLVTAFASLLVDPVVKRANASLKKVIAAKAKALVADLRANGQTVTGGSGSSVTATDTGIVLPRVALAEIDGGADAAAALSLEEFDEFRARLEALVSGARTLATALGRTRQRGLVLAKQREDDETEARIWNGYIDRLAGVGADLDRASRMLLADITGANRDTAEAWVNVSLNLPRLRPDDPLLWENVRYDHGYLRPEVTRL